jgi:hypothetical protein
MVELKNYVVINTPLVESLARQLNLPIDQERTSESQFGLVGKVGIGFKRSVKHAPLSSDDPRLLAPIVAALRESGQLRVSRPDNTNEFWRDSSNWYVHETAIALPILLPFDKVKQDADHFPEAVTVWVIGIDDIEYNAGVTGNWAGPHVFIVQEMTSFPQAATYISGISALRIIKEVVIDSSVTDFEEWQNQYNLGGPDFGYQAYRNAINEFRRMGGVVRRPRQIETIYKIAYMSHQEGRGRGGIKRIGDIFAYPLFIAE